MHTLRRSYASHALLNGIPINSPNRWMGQTNTETTLIYLKLIPHPIGTLASIA
jgi:site-specific recombinase XerD